MLANNTALPVLAEAYSKAKDELSQLRHKLASLQAEKDSLYTQFEALQALQVQYNKGLDVSQPRGNEGMDEMHEILAKSVQEKEEQVSKLQVQVCKIQRRPVSPYRELAPSVLCLSCAKIPQKPDAHKLYLLALRLTPRGTVEGSAGC